MGLDDAEQARLVLHAQVAHFVQEEGPAVALFQESFLPAGRPGECALLVSKEFALEEFPGDCRAIDGDQRQLMPCAVVVDHPRGQFLARTGLAEDQNVQIALGRALNRAPRLAHDGTGPKQENRVRLGVAQPFRLQFQGVNLLHGMQPRCGNTRGRQQELQIEFVVGASRRMGMNRQGPDRHPSHHQRRRHQDAGIGHRGLFRAGGNQGAFQCLCSTYNDFTWQGRNRAVY